MADEKSPEQLQQEMFEQAALAPVEEPTVTEPEEQPPSEPSPAAAEPTPPVQPPPEPAEVPIPSWRLREEAEARRVAEDRARALEQRLNEIAVHLRQQEKKPDFFENPDQATEAVIMRTFQPYVEEQKRGHMYNSQMLAKYVHGKEKVEAAEQAFLEAKDRGSLDSMDYERVVQSPNRWDAVVEWHNKQTVLSSVGSDPDAWYKKRRDAEREAEMNDPKFQAEVMERAKVKAASRPSETRIPPSLSRSTAASSNSGEAKGDMSDLSLFRYAMDTKRPQ